VSLLLPALAAALLPLAVLDASPVCFSRNTTAAPKEA
jgi:hypothetical protein